MDVSEGQILLAAEAKTILDAFFITRDYYIGPDGKPVEYKGNTYVILQREVTWPGPTVYSPDGVHIVYLMSQEEIQRRKNQIENEGKTWFDNLTENLLKVWDSIKPYLFVILALIIAYAIYRGYRAVKG